MKKVIGKHRFENGRLVTPHSFEKKHSKPIFIPKKKDVTFSRRETELFIKTLSKVWSQDEVN